MKSALIFSIFGLLSHAAFSQNLPPVVDASLAIGVALKKFQPGKFEYFSGINSQLKIGSDLNVGLRVPKEELLRSDKYYWLVNISVKSTAGKSFYGYVAIVDSETAEIVH